MPVIDWVNEQVPLAGLMAAIACGFWLGRQRVRGMGLGPAGGTLFVALALGALGLSMPAGGGTELDGISLGTVGLALFIYSVGFDAAPHFFATFRDRRGLRFLAVAAAVNVAAAGAAIGVAFALSIPAADAAGMLSGALTSAPTYAAAWEIAPSADDRAAMSVAFALSYPFGLLGIVLAIQLLPRLFGDDLLQDARSDEELAARLQRKARPAAGAPETTRVFRVTGESVIGRSLGDPALTRETGCVISRLERDGRVVVPNKDTILELRDRVLATGRLDELAAFETLVGPEDLAGDMQQLPTKRIVVRRDRAIGKSLAELGLIGRFSCVIVCIERGRLWLEPDASVILVRDDVVEVVGERRDLRRLADELGRVEPSLQETDIAVYAGGIALGLLLGELPLPFATRLELGTAPAVLAVGLALGWERRLGPFRTHVPLPARQLVRDLGILLFIGETGLQAGSRLLEALGERPWTIFAGGAIVHLAAVLAGLLVARALLGLRPIDSWGSVCGGLTSSAALAAVRQASDSNEAAISYAAAYGLASVLATLAGPLVFALLSSPS